MVTINVMINAYPVKGQIKQNTISQYLENRSKDFVNFEIICYLLFQGIRLHVLY